MSPTRLKWLGYLIGGCIGLSVACWGPLRIHAQDTLSQQVLQLLVRDNTWTGTQTFDDLRVPLIAVPSDTTARLYADPSGNLYYRGIVIANATQTVPPHNLLSTTHSDTVPGSIAIGDIISVDGILGGWKRLPVGTPGQVLSVLSVFNGFSFNSEPRWTTLSLVNADVASNAAIAYSKLALTGGIVNADIANSAAITSGKLNLSNGILNTDINSAAAIAYSKLNLTGGIVNADVNASAAIAYTKLNLGTSIVNADINGSAAIAYTKLNLTGSIVNTDVKSDAAIAYGKLALIQSINNGDISNAAAIAYSKLSLANSIRNTDIYSAAAIHYTKLNLASSVVNSDITAGTLAFDRLASNGCASGNVPTYNGSAWVCGTPATGSVTSVGLTLPASVFAVAGSPVTGSGTLAGTFQNQAKNTIFSGPTTGSDAIPSFRAIVGKDITHNILDSTFHGDVLTDTVVAGDLIVGNATPAWARLAKGPDGYLFGVSRTSHVPAWVANVSLPVGRTIGFAAADGSNPTTWDVEEASGYGAMTLATNGTRGFTIHAFPTTPTINTGFGTTPSLTARSTDSNGEVVVGTGGVATTGAIDFATTWTNGAPHCLVQDETTNIATRVTTTSTTTMTITAATAWTAADKIVWHCFGT